MLMLVEALQSLPDEWLMAVLGEVFAQRRPYRDDAESTRNRHFVGIVRRERDPRTGAWAGVVHHTAVAYPDPDHYGGEVGPCWGFCQSGTCQACRVDLASNCKNVRCPICHRPKYLT